MKLPVIEDELVSSKKEYVSVAVNANMKPFLKLFSSQLIEPYENGNVVTMYGSSNAGGI